MNPKVCLKNIWQELADSGTAVNLIPPAVVRNSISIRYNARTKSLFGDEN